MNFTKGEIKCSEFRTPNDGNLFFPEFILRNICYYSKGMIKLKAFLRWAGGKVHITQHLIKYVPRDFNKYTYWEPFLGGGSMFFALSPDKAILSDLNVHLINCYKMVRNHPDKVHYYLKTLSRKNNKEIYYKLREVYNKSQHSIKQAARFIYLNKTSYNGIFRVNKFGLYNVPFGRKERPTFPSLDALRCVSVSLRRAKLYSGSYEKILKNVRKGDFVYLDPPYPPLNGTSFFTHYTKERFGEYEQSNVLEVANRISRLGCRVMISNADIPLIHNFYKDWNISAIPVTRWITCKSSRHKVNELVITNY
jgi:DNA adenine methylase